MKKLIFLNFALYTIANCYSQTSEEFYKRGIIKDSLRDYKGAIVDYTKAIEIDGKYVDAYYKRGVARSAFIPIDSSGFTILDIQGAILDFTTVIEINPNYKNTYYLRGRAKLDLTEDYEGAILDFTKAIQLDPNKVIIYQYLYQMILIFRYV